jgi:hypothetical protein
MADNNITVIYNSELELYVPSIGKSLVIELVSSDQDSFGVSTATPELTSTILASGRTSSMINSQLAGEIIIKMFDYVDNENDYELFKAEQGMTGVMRYFSKPLTIDTRGSAKSVMEYNFKGLRHLGGRTTFHLQGKNPIETKFAFDSRIIKQNVA